MRRWCRECNERTANRKHPKRGWFLMPKSENSKMNVNKYGHRRIAGHGRQTVFFDWGNLDKTKKSRGIQVNPVNPGHPFFENHGRAVSMSESTDMIIRVLWSVRVQLQAAGSSAIWNLSNQDEHPTVNFTMINLQAIYFVTIFDHQSVAKQFCKHVHQSFIDWTVESRYSTAR